MITIYQDRCWQIIIFKSWYFQSDCYRSFWICSNPNNVAMVLPNTGHGMAPHWPWYGPTLALAQTAPGRAVQGVLTGSCFSATGHLLLVILPGASGGSWLNRRPGWSSYHRQYLSYGPLLCTI